MPYEEALESESYVTTDGQSASLSWNKAPSGSLRPDLYYCQTVAGLLMWGALSDERTGLSVTIAAGPRQCSHSRVRVPWDSRPYFTVPDSILPFSSPSTTRRATVGVFDPALTRDNLSLLNPWTETKSMRTEYRSPHRTVSYYSVLSVAAETSEPLPSKLTSTSVAIPVFRQCLQRYFLSTVIFRHSMFKIPTGERIPKIC
jgi:hypothetical protein